MEQRIKEICETRVRFGYRRVHVLLRREGWEINAKKTYRVYKELEYVWFEGVPVAVVEGNQVYLVRTDHIGRPVFATDMSGAKVWEASYLPFGGVYVSSGANSDLRFPGQWFQSEAGLHQNWMRDYDPTTGRYMQADPLGLVDGASVYGYVLQNPGRYIDPRGEQSIPNTSANIPGGPYTPNPKGRPGSFLGPKQPKGPRAACQWVPKGGPSGSIGYWKVQQPGQGTQRYSQTGQPLTPACPSVEPALSHESLGCYAA